MNRSYKVVFNKVRGALMVANELTSAVQKKGTKTVLALSAGLLLATPALAIESGDVITQDPNGINSLETVLADKVLDRVTVSGQQALHGSVGRVELGANLLVTNSVFKGNKAASSYAQGGVFQLNTSSITTRDTLFEGNSSEGYGGAASSTFDQPNALNFTRTTFKENAALLGGALALYYGANIVDSAFVGNYTTGIEDGGGAIVLGGHAKISVVNTDFTGNKSNLGGAISTRSNTDLDLVLDGHYLQIYRSRFTANEAAGRGDTYVTGKMFNGDGGAVWTGFKGTTLADGTQFNRIEDTVFESNRAGNNGGAVYN